MKSKRLPMSSSGRQKQESVDRFIPQRSCSKSNKTSQLLLNTQLFKPHKKLAVNSKMEKILQEKIFPYKQSRILNFKEVKEKSKNKKNKKQIMKYIQPYRVLQSPGLIKKDYSNPIDWSSQNIIALPLHNQFYLYNEQQKSVEQLSEIKQQLCALKFDSMGKNLVCGDQKGLIKLFDLGQKIIQLGHICQFGGMPIKIFWGSDFIFYSFTKNGIVRRFDKRTNFKNNQIVFSSMRGIKCADLSTYNNNFVVGNKSGKILTVDLRKEQQLLNQTKAFGQNVNTVCFDTFRPSTIYSTGGKYSNQIVQSNVYQRAILKQKQIKYSIADLQFLKSSENFALALNDDKEDYSFGIWSRDFQLIEKYKVKEDSQEIGFCKVLNIVICPNQSKAVTTHYNDSFQLWKLKKQDSELKSSKQELQLR